MTKAKSVMAQVKEFVAAHPKFTTKEVREAHPKIPSGQISTALWKLTNLYKMIRSVGEGQYELTPVNNTEQGAVEAQADKPKAKRKYKPRANSPVKRVEQLKKELEHANREILHWSTKAKNTDKLMYELRQADADLKEALVLIRYLENKLVTAIQYDAKHNGSDT